MSGSTISTKVTIGVSLGAGGYTSPLTITSTGVIAPTTAVAGVSLSSGMVINFGSVIGGSTQYSFYPGPISSSPGLNMTGGTFINDGFIAGGTHGTGAVGVYLDGGSLVNAGTIAGFARGTITQDAVEFGTASGQLIVDPGAVFIGAVAANYAVSDGLQLASTMVGQTGSLDLGGSFTGFSTITFDPGASWLLAGSSGELAGGEVIDGFTAGDTLRLEGFASTSYTYVAGIGLELSNATTIETLGVNGNFSTDSFVVLSQPNDTEIEFSNNTITPASTINGNIAFGVTLGSGGYNSVLSITGAGAVDPAGINATGVTGIYAGYSGGSILNQGNIVGGAGSQVGGTGVALNGSYLRNTGEIAGGVGGATGGDGVNVASGALFASGVIIGGDAAETGGYGLYLQSGTVTNYGEIGGGAGGTANGTGVVMKTGVLDNQAGALIVGGVGAGSAGVGFQQSGGSVMNAGSIAGGDGGSTAGSGGAGAVLSGGVLLNKNAISGGSGGTDGGNGGNAIDLSNATLNNYGSITGGNAGASTLEASGGIGVSILNGTFINAGSVTGGYGGYDGDAVVLDGGSASNTGAIAGSKGVYVLLGTFSNNGTISGGRVGIGADISGGTLNNNFGGFITGGLDGGGVGVSLSGGALINAGDISSSGIRFGYGYGPGDAGAVVTGGTLLNTGFILGAAGTGDDATGAGILMEGGSLTNDGFIGGGAGSYESFFAVSGGAGAVITGGTFLNNDAILGGEGGVAIDYTAAAGGIGVSLSNAVLIDDGTIEGGAGGSYVGFHITLSAPAGDAIEFGSVAATLIVEPSAVFIGSVVADGTNDMLQLAGTAATTGTLQMGGSFSGFSTIAFDPGASWLLTGTTAELAAHQTITGLSATDTIELDGFTGTTYKYVVGTGLEIKSAGIAVETVDITGDFSTGSFMVLDNAAGTEIVICYMRGTRILTPTGEVEVETLKIGDPLITRFNGIQPVKWIGRQSYAARFIKNNPERMPVRIRANALGDSLPVRDLYVSPGHSMLVNGALVLAKLLINGITITQGEMPEEVHFYSIEFEQHDCVIAEGTWSESYADMDWLRSQFHNSADFYDLYPDYRPPEKPRLCLPRPEHGAALERDLRPVVARASRNLQPGPLRGWIDSVTAPWKINGWVQDLHHPELPVLLELFFAERSLGTILACDYRLDLKENAIGQGRCSFSFVSPINIPAEKITQLSARRQSDGAAIFMTEDCLVSRRA